MKKRRIIFGILIILWMITIFCFSAQVADDSTQTSGNTIRAIMKLFPSTRNLNIEEEEIIVSKMQPIIRKFAHLSMYTIGGVIIYNFAKTFNIVEKKKIVYSLLFGLGYAITDELHQCFVPNRSCEIRDVCIDTSGIVIGILIVILVSKILINVRNKNIAENF